MKYTTINIQGNLLSEEILQKIECGEAQKQQAIDFGFEPGTNLRSEIEYAWSRIKLDWKQFAEKSQNLPASDPYGTTLSRRWMEQFFSSLGFNHARQKSNLIGDNNQGYSISHTADNLDELPIHIVGFNEPDKPEKNTLDIKTSGGTSRLSPHATMQEYLNVTEHLFGIATNGLHLRLIRDSGRLIKLTYVEFDLKRLLDEDKYSEFTLLFRLLHASRFPRIKAEADQCLLEKYYQDSIEAGNRIRDGLSLAVKESLLALGIGFLQHGSNNVLREKIQNGTLTPKEYYRQLLRIIYRFLFLMVTEERDLVYDSDDKTENTQRLKKIYWQFYSIARLRKLCENRYVFETQFNDLWQGLVQTFQLFEAGGTGKKLGIQPLAGDLFSYTAIKDLQECLISNKLLLECVRNMNEFRDEKKNLVHINYRSLDVEELGSVYEGLLELHPVIENIEAENAAHINFTFHEGTDRKTTGSYYTRPELVNELIKSALIPVIEERLKQQSGNKEAQAKALLKLKVCDAAAGSGHMLLAAARTIAWYLARVQSGEENPAPSIYRSCLREVIQHCIYAVDFNPDAVELCKLALWLEGHNSGKPLSFLDHKIRNGNSLIGVTDLSVLKKGIPEEAYNPVTGDDKQVCQWYKKLAKEENKTQYQTRLDFNAPDIEQTESKGFANEYRELENLPENSVEQSDEKAIRFNQLRNNAIWFKDWNACNIWTSAFFYNYTQVDDPAAPTSAKLKTFLKTPTGIDGRVVGKASLLAMEHKFFHWPLEFPDVFEQGGFDVMLGNPPWEAIQPEEKGYFQEKLPTIASLSGNKRKKAIEALKETNPILFEDWLKYSRDIISLAKFINESKKYPLTTSGKLNTYSLFTELNTKLVSTKGRISIVVPTGIASDNSNKAFFEYVLSSKRLDSLYGFENESFIFPSVHHSFKFCLLTITGEDISIDKSRFIFFCRKIDDIKSSIRSFEIGIKDIALINPNTKTCPIFRTNKDYSITINIYQTYPIILDIETKSNPWKIQFKQGIYNMTSDSNLFIEENEKNVLPLYEAKMIYHFDHRYSTYENATQAQLNMGTLPNLPIEDKQNSEKTIRTRYFVKKDVFQRSLDEIHENYLWKRNWFLCFRDVTSSISERTSIFSIVPNLPLGNNIPVCFSKTTTIDSALLLSNFNSLVFDFIARQKVAGNHLNFFIIEQLPIIPKSKYTAGLIYFIVQNIIELTYSVWDIKSFADDVWKEADADLKASIQRQWEANKVATGGHSWAPPEWCEIDTEGCPLPPFKWDEERRALLKAELDAIYAKLYGLTTEELRYILDPQDVYGPDFPGETFRVLKEKEIRLYGEYRTRRLVLEAWEKLNINL